MRAVLVSALILGVSLVLMLGTVQVLPTYNVPATYRCSVIVEPGHTYSIRIVGSEAKDFSVSQNGQVTIEGPAITSQL